MNLPARFHHQFLSPLFLVYLLASTRYITAFLAKAPSKIAKIDITSFNKREQTLSYCVNDIIHLQKSMLRNNEKPLFMSRNENDFVEDNDLSRRDMMGKSAILFSSILTGSIGFGTANAEEPLPASSSSPKNILITGCNSGIGFDAALRMASKGNNVILACRTLSKAQDTAARIAAEQQASGQTSSGKLIPGECDLSDLSSIKRFVEDLQKNDIFSGDNKKLDVVCYNAGLAPSTEDKESKRTKDGFELTVGTNHLGHFYLNSLLLPLISPQTGRIVITASGVHDPATGGGKQGTPATLGDLKGLETKDFDMIDGGAYNPDKVYKDSKLCNVFFARELQRRLSESNNIKVYAFNPGLIVSTGLFRNQNPLFTKVFDFAATDLFKVGESVAWGGGALEYLALAGNLEGADLGIEGLYYDSPPGTSQKYGEAGYGKQFKPTEVSKEAHDDAKGKKLWELSEKLLSSV